jgi:hypothetical protein
MFQIGVHLPKLLMQQAIQFAGLLNYARMRQRKETAIRLADSRRKRRRRRQRKFRFATTYLQSICIEQKCNFCKLLAAPQIRKMTSRCPFK